MWQRCHVTEISVISEISAIRSSGNCQEVRQVFSQRSADIEHSNVIFLLYSPEGIGRGVFGKHQVTIGGGRGQEGSAESVTILAEESNIK